MNANPPRAGTHQTYLIYGAKVVIQHPYQKIAKVNNNSRWFVQKSQDRVLLLS